MKKNKIFSIICACFLVALACISFVMPKNKNLNTSSAYFSNGGNITDSLNSAMPVYIGFNNFGIDLNGVSTSGPPYDTGTTSTGSNYVNYKIIDMSNYSNLLYDLQNFGGLYSVQDITTATDIYKSYLNYVGSFSLHSAFNENATDKFSCKPYFYLQLTGVNNDFYITSVDSVVLTVGGESFTLSNTDVINGSNGSNITGSFLIDLSRLTLFQNMSFYDFLSGFNVRYNFTTDLSAEVFVTCGFVLADSFSDLFYNLTINLETNITNQTYSGVQSLQFYYYGVYNSGSSYYNSYWNEYYTNLYNNQIEDIRNNSYNSGYNSGYAEGVDNSSILPGAIMSFATLPFSILSGFLNFNLFGFNLYTLILSLCTLLLCIWLIKKIKA